MDYAGILILIQSARFLVDLTLKAETYSAETAPNDFFQSLSPPNLQSLRLNLMFAEPGRPSWVPSKTYEHLEQSGLVISTP